MSALGHEQTSRHIRVMSVIPLKADIHQRGFACPPLLCLAQRETGAERVRNRARDIESQRASFANRRVAHRDIEWVWQQALPA